MITKLKPKSEFSRNVLTLMTGTTIAQAIPIAISPILTRIYTPEDFGVFALFIAIASIFGSIANGRYELAIMLPKKDEDAINIFALGFIITSVVSLTLLILVVLFHDYFVTILNNKEIRLWLYFVPIAVFFTGFFNILNYFNIRQKNYKDIAKATVFKSIVLAIVQLGIGFIKHGVTGLISGQLLSQFTANTKLLLNIIRNKKLISKISKVKIIALARKYQDFPKYSMPGGLASTISQNLTNILISSFYSVATLGFYSLVQRVLAMPASLVGTSIGQVFFQQATKEKHTTGKSINSLKTTTKKLLIIGLPSFGLLFFIVEDLFALVFGEEWRIAGTYAKILIPMFFIRFISSPTSGIYDIFNKMKIELIWKIILMLGIISLLYIFRNDNFLEFLKIMSFYALCMYSISIYLVFQFAKGKIKL